VIVRTGSQPTSWTYNHNKRGVEFLDEVIGTYSCRRMTARWPLVIFHNTIDVSSYNAYVI
jgi:hypothetical protein